MLELVPEVGLVDPVRRHRGRADLRRPGARHGGRHLPTLEEVESILAGWPDQMAKPDGISWVAERLRANGVTATPPA